jgi:hypothetical protein
MTAFVKVNPNLGSDGNTLTATFGALKLKHGAMIR